MTTTPATGTQIPAIEAPAGTLVTHGAVTGVKLDDYDVTAILGSDEDDAVLIQDRDGALHPVDKYAYVTVADDTAVTDLINRIRTDPSIDDADAFHRHSGGDLRRRGICDDDTVIYAAVSRVQAEQDALEAAATATTLTVYATDSGAPPVVEHTAATFQDRQRDAALQRIREQHAADTKVTDALNLMRGDHAENVIHITDSTAVVQVVAYVTHGTDRTRSSTYTVVHNGQPARVHTETLELALLLAVQIMAGGRSQDCDYVYAGRVLRV